MYLFLLVFGAVLSVAGVILAASGLSVHDHTFDASLVTPGIVAVVGGLLLIGLGFALRVLQRIELALETRPAMPRAVRAAATPEPAAAEPKTEPSRIPFSTRIARPPQPAATASPFAETPADELPLKFPSIARAAPAPSFEDESLPKLPLRTTDEAEEPAAEENAGPFASRALKARNGAAPPPRVSPRLDASARAPLKVQRPIGPAFDALWPKGGRRGAAQAAPVSETAEPIAQSQIEDQIREQVQARLQDHLQEPDQEPAHQPTYTPVEEDAVETTAEERAAAASPAVAPEAEPEDAPEPVSVLKSGIVDGMAYTLYSDGSIEAQLPQGLLRFGSISELRAHIEQDTRSA
jgi:hypothetical protein